MVTASVEVGSIQAIGYNSCDPHAMAVHLYLLIVALYSIYLFIYFFFFKVFVDVGSDLSRHLVVTSLNNFRAICKANCLKNAKKKEYISHAMKLV